MSQLGTHLPSRFGWIPTKIVGPLVMTNLAAAAAAIAGSNSIAAFVEAASYTHARTRMHSPPPSFATYLLTSLLAAGRQP